MYYSSARQLGDAKDKNAKQIVLREFVQKLKSRVPAAEEFDAGFRELWFTNDQARLRQLVRYLLRRLDQHLRSGTKADYDTMNIEHIAPQNADGKSSVSEEYVGLMGNLILLDAELNGKLGNKTPIAKLKNMRAEKVPLDDNLKTAKSWTDKAVDERTDELAKLFRTKIVNL